jgi:hypothetical protein
MSNSGQNNLPVQSHGRLGTYIPPKHSGPERKNDFAIFTDGQVSAENREFEKLLKDSLMVGGISSFLVFKLLDITFMNDVYRS